MRENPVFSSNVYFFTILNTYDMFKYCQLVNREMTDTVIVYIAGKEMTRGQATPQGQVTHNQQTYVSVIDFYNDSIHQCAMTTVSEHSVRESDADMVWNQHDINTIVSSHGRCLQALHFLNI